jgi:Protein of unknown function (DUF3306)
MSDDAKPDGFSLRRWSARKHATAASPAAFDRASESAPVSQPAAPALPSPAQPHVASTPVGPLAPADRAVSGERHAPAGSAPSDMPLPPVDSLTPQSDFTPFMRPDVEPALRGAALRKLFADPHFNVMDGLDVYIDDYSKPDPIAPDVVKLLKQARYVFAPPPTRLTPQGHVEDAPIEALAQPPEVAQDARPVIGGPESPAIAPGAPNLAGGAPEQIALPLDVPADPKP